MLPTLLPYCCCHLHYCFYSPLCCCCRLFNIEKYFRSTKGSLFWNPIDGAFYWDMLLIKNFSLRWIRKDNTIRKSFNNFDHLLILCKTSWILAQTRDIKEIVSQKLPPPAHPNLSPPSSLETSSPKEKAQTNISTHRLKGLLRGRYKIRTILPFPVCFHQTFWVEGTPWTKAFQSY